MSTTPSPDRRFIVALTAAVASVTLAIGVTAAALLGWLGPKPGPGGSSAGSGSSQVVYVPITPATPPPSPSIERSTTSEPRLAISEPRSHHDRDDRREHGDEDDDD